METFYAIYVNLEEYVKNEERFIFFKKEDLALAVAHRFESGC